MITLFSVPKPFTGHIAVIQENAVKSWMQVHPDIEIILYGDEKGITEICDKYDLVHVNKIKKNEYGTPTLDFIFENAQKIAKNNILCYVNADILLFRTILQTVNTIIFEKYLMIGQRIDLDITQVIDFTDTFWEKKLNDKILATGNLHSPAGLDYFIFPKDTFSDFPPFVVGRPGWDNWMIFYMKSLKIPVIDGTQKILAVHQNHDYSHRPGGLQEIFSGDEAKNNYRLLGGWEYAFNAWNADWILTDNGIKPARELKYIIRKFKAVPVLVPWLRFLNYPEKIMHRISHILKKNQWTYFL